MVENVTFVSEIMNQSQLSKHLIRRKLPKFVGLTKAKIKYRLDDNSKYYTCVVKSLLSGQDVQLVIESITKNCGELLSSYMARFYQRLPYHQCQTREWRINDETPEPLHKFIPKRLACYQNLKQDAHIIIMEDLRIPNHGFLEEPIAAAKALGALHRKLTPYFNEDLYNPTVESLSESEILWGSLIQNGKQLFPEWYDEDVFKFQILIHFLLIFLQLMPLTALMLGILMFSCSN